MTECGSVEEYVARMRRAKERLESLPMTDGSEQMMQMLSKLFEIKAKYENLRGVLSRHVENPDDLREVEEVLGKAGADDLLDKLMETTGHDQYVDFEEFVCDAARERDLHKGMIPLAWVETEDHGDITTTPDFWDCGCTVDYVHPKTEDVCPKCGFKRDEQPDSRMDEVLWYYRNKLGLSRNGDKEEKDNASK